jgi:hypothetical protein
VPKRECLFIRHPDDSKAPFDMRPIDVTTSGSKAGLAHLLETGGQSFIRDDVGRVGGRDAAGVESLDDVDRATGAVREVDVMRLTEGRWLDSESSLRQFYAENCRM